MRVLLTGHLGYIGTVMAPLLAEAGHEVVGLDSGLFEQCTFGEPPRQFPYIRKDIRDATPADLEGFECARDRLYRLRVVSKRHWLNGKPITLSISTA